MFREKVYDVSYAFVNLIRKENILSSFRFPLNNALLGVTITENFITGVEIYCDHIFIKIQS